MRTFAGRRPALDDDDGHPSTPPMAIPVVTALITAAVSLVLAVGKILWDAREKGRDRQLAARERLDWYRAPLLP